MNERPVQRYFLNMYVHSADVMQPAATNPSLTEPSGDWVLYAEHVAALRACEERVRHENPLLAVSYKGCYNDGLIDAREAVEVAVTDALEALDPLDPHTVNRALAAIDALHDEPCEACNGTGHVKCWSPGGPCPAGQKECECCGPCRQCDSLAAIEALQMEPK